MVADGQPVDPSIVDINLSPTGWMEGLGSGPLESVEPLAGGTQNLLLRFVATGARSSFVGRRSTNARTGRQPRGSQARRPRRHRRAASALIAAEGDIDVLGAVLYLMEPIDGPGDPRGSLHPRAGSGGTSFDGLLVRRCPAVVACGRSVDEESRRFGKPEGYLKRQVPRWQSQLESYNEMEGYPGPDLPYLAEIQAFLEANRPEPSPTGIIHGDYHLANVMFRPDAGEIAAIVDWELATQGDPLIDLGLVVAFAPKPTVRRG